MLTVTRQSLTKSLVSLIKQQGAPWSAVMVRRNQAPAYLHCHTGSCVRGKEQLFVRWRLHGMGTLGGHQGHTFVLHWDQEMSVGRKLKVQSIALIASTKYVAYFDLHHDLWLVSVEFCACWHYDVCIVFLYICFIATHLTIKKMLCLPVQVLKQVKSVIFEENRFCSNF